MRKLNQQILDEAAQWYVDLRDEPVATVRSEFLNWLRVSPEHIRMYLEVKAGMSRLPRPGEFPGFDATAVIARARKEISENVVQLRPSISAEEGQERVSPRFSPAVRGINHRSAMSRGPLLALAACLAIAAILLPFSFLSQGQVYATGRAEVLALTLEDGSALHLDGLSKVRVQFSKSERRVTLISGQALFQVAHNAKRPFYVTSGAATVRAVGTQFDVNQDERGTSVTVVEGRVEVSNRGHVHQRAYVNAGEQTRVPAGPQTWELPTVEPANAPAATGWVNKHLELEATPLEQVVTEFNRHSQRTLVLDDPQATSYAIGGIYSLDDPEAFVRFLKAQPDLEVRESSTEIHVAKRHPLRSAMLP